MSGSLLVDPNSTITAEFAQRYYDGDYYRGLILYDKKDSSSDNTQIGEFHERGIQQIQIHPL